MNTTLSSRPFVGRIQWQAIALSVLIAVTTSMHGQTAVGNSPAQVANPAPASAAKASGAAQESAQRQGIQVSGYWKLDVRNQDGSLAKHVEFENALTTNAVDMYLPSLLFGQSLPYTSPSGLRSIGTEGFDLPAIGINLGPSSSVYNTFPNISAGAFAYYFPTIVSDGPCESGGCLIAGPTSAAYNNCYYYVYQVVTTFAPVFCVNTLTVSPVSATGQITLSGTLTANSPFDNGTTITSVETYLTVCLNDTSTLSVNGCHLSSTQTAGAQQLTATILDLTSYTLPTPIPIQNTQVLNVSVTLSFSSPPATSSSARGAKGASPSAQAAKPSGVPRQP